MQCQECAIELIHEEYFMVCPNCGVSNSDFLYFAQPDYTEMKFWHPMIYSRSDYFIKILFENSFTLEEIQVYMKLFSVYLEAFDYVKPRKNLLSRKFVMNEFNRILNKPIIYNRPIKTSKSLKRVKIIWKKLINSPPFETCPLK